MTQKGIITMVRLRPKRLRLGSVGLALVKAVDQVAPRV